MLLLAVSSCEELNLPPPLPAAPTEMTATAQTDYTIELAWIDNATNETGFKVERKTGENGIFRVIGVVAFDITSCIDSGTSESLPLAERALLPETEYYYRVCAYNRGGDSDYSNEISATTPVEQAPSTPTGLTAELSGDTSVGLLWNDTSDNEEGFRIERRKGSFEDFFRIGEVSANASTYLDPHLEPNTIYYYRVCAFNETGNSSYSSLVGETTRGITPNPYPAVPGDFKVITVSESSIGLTWTDTSISEDGFRIERKTTAGGTYYQIDEVKPNATSFLDMGLESSKNYHYRIQAFNQLDNSEYTEERSAKTQDPAGYSVTRHTVSNSNAFDGATAVFSMDMDGDGDSDVLGAAANANDITWWENDGSEGFTAHIIDGSFGGADDVYAADLDGDGDTDVLGAADGAGEIAWWENNGSENFSKTVIDPSFGDAEAVHAADVDGDGDIDILGAAYGSDLICWYENDGSGTFTKNTVDGYDGAYNVHATDLDGDGDVDVIGASSVWREICWWENDGSQNFTKYVIENDFNGVRSIYAADVDGDGDVDVLGAAYYADEISWWENDGSQGFTKHAIDSTYDGAYSVYADDMDGDGDVDVLGGAALAYDVTWWENDGSEVFTKRTIDGDFMAPNSVYSLDIDGDGDMDVVSAGFAADEIAWWEMSY